MLALFTLMTVRSAMLILIMAILLAGLDPMEAVKYQILLMFLLSGGAGLATVAVVFLAARRLTDWRQRLRLDRLLAGR